jgi:hypothetical protein
MPKFDITKLNVAVDQLLETTENPRHRFPASSVWPSPLPGVAGRREEICAPDMMITDPVFPLPLYRPRI